MAEIRSVFITGASRGIGLEFVKQFLSNPLVRTIVLSLPLAGPQRKPRVTDVTEFGEYDRVVQEVSDIVGENGLTLLINNAGIGVDPGDDILNNVTAELFISRLTMNSIAPVLLAKAFLPLLKVSAQINAGKDKDGLSVTRAAVINISSQLGSITRNDRGEHWVYRESKVALNMSTHSLAKELQKEGILVEAFHTGRVETDMTASQGFTDMISTVMSVTGMLEVFLSIKEKNNEGILTFKGEVIPY